MTRMTRPDCAVMCNLINTHTHTHAYTHERRPYSGTLYPNRLMVDVPTRAFWLAGIFLRRKKRCAGVVGTRTDWVLKGEEGGMTTPLLQYVARFDGGGEMFGFGGGGYKESWSWCSLFVEYPSLFVATSGEKPALRFRPRAVVAGRGVVAVCTRISSQEYVYDK